MSTSAKPRPDPDANGRKDPARSGAATPRDRDPPAQAKPASAPAPRVGSWKKFAEQSARRALGLLCGALLFVVSGGG